MNANSPKVECTIPILSVRNLARSIAFYTGILEFNLDWGGEANSFVCSVSRDAHAIMLQQRDAITDPTWVWIGLVDDSLFEIYRSKGVKVLQEPKNCSWAYETKVQDIDGNILWLGTDPKKDQPFEDRPND